MLGRIQTSNEPQNTVQDSRKLRLYSLCFVVGIDTTNSEKGCQFYTFGFALSSKQSLGPNKSLDNNKFLTNETVIIWPEECNILVFDRYPIYTDIPIPIPTIGIGIGIVMDI